MNKEFFTLGSSRISFSGETVHIKEMSGCTDMEIALEIPGLIQQEPDHYIALSIRPLPQCCSWNNSLNPCNDYRRKILLPFCKWNFNSGEVGIAR